MIWKKIMIKKNIWLPNIMKVIISNSMFSWSIPIRRCVFVLIHRMSYPRWNPQTWGTKGWTSMNFRGTDKQSEYVTPICCMGINKNKIPWFLEPTKIFVFASIRAFSMPNNWDQIKKRGQIKSIVQWSSKYKPKQCTISSEKPIKITIHFCIQFRLSLQKNTHHTSPHITLWVNI